MCGHWFCFFFYRRLTLRTISIEKEALKKRIQVDTQTTIKFTKIRADGREKRVLEIKGATHNDVYSARQQIKAINRNDNTQSKQSTQPTHFTCVKIIDPMIKENFSKLKVCRKRRIRNEFFFFHSFMSSTVCIAFHFTGGNFNHSHNNQPSKISFYETRKIAHNIWRHVFTQRWESHVRKTAAVRLPWENIQVSDYIAYTAALI